MQGVTSANWSYTEYAQLPGGIKNDAEGLEEAAKHFESLFINMWLKSAREANAAIAKDSFFSSNEMEMQQQMFDSQLAMHLSKEGGIGLAPTIMRQLGGASDPEQADPAGTPTEFDRVETSHPQITARQSSGTRQQAFTDADSFLSSIAPKIKKIVEDAGLPSIAVIAQAVLETGWGQSVIADNQGRSTHNLFGVKANGWQGPSVEIHSKEFLLGQWQDKRDGFRSYPDWESGIADYVKTLTGSDRYAQATQTGITARDYVEGLQQAGYATDPQYAQKLKSIMHRVAGMGL
jgi:peptidoglycan hydrolase FlgJ